jgi:hypothetical protein
VATWKLGSIPATTPSILSYGTLIRIRPRKIFGSTTPENKMLVARKNTVVQAIQGGDVSPYEKLRPFALISTVWCAPVRKLGMVKEAFEASYGEDLV